MKNFKCPKCESKKYADPIFSKRRNEINAPILQCLNCGILYVGKEDIK